MATFRVGMLELPSKGMAVGWIRDALHDLDDGEPFPVIEQYIIRNLFPKVRDETVDHFIVSRKHDRYNSGAPAICPVKPDGKRARPVSWEILFNPKASPQQLVDSAIRDLRKDHRERLIGNRRSIGCAQCMRICAPADVHAHHGGEWTASMIRDAWISRNTVKPIRPGSLMMENEEAFREFHDRHAVILLVCEPCHAGLHKQSPPR